MIDWEKRTTANQTWTLAQEYFTELYNDNKQYSKATADKRNRESTNNITNKTTEEEKELNDAAMMFTMMKETHKEQLNEMRERVIVQRQRRIRKFWR